MQFIQLVSFRIISQIMIFLRIWWKLICENVIVIAFLGNTTVGQTKMQDSEKCLPSVWLLATLLGYSNQIQLMAQFKWDQETEKTENWLKRMTVLFEGLFSVHLRLQGKPSHGAFHICDMYWQTFDFDGWFSLETAVSCVTPTNNIKCYSDAQLQIGQAVAVANVNLFTVLMLA